MNVLDITLLVALGGFVLAGFWFGLIHMVGAFAGMIVGVWAAGHFNTQVSEWIVSVFGGNINLIRVLAFVLTYSIAARLVGVLFWFVEKIFGLITIIPFLKTFDRLLGAALGFVEGMLAIGLAVYFMGRFPISERFAELLHASQFAPKFQAVGSVLAPLLPDAIRILKSVI